MLILTIIKGPDKGRTFELPDHEPQLVGRSSEALPLTDSTVSRRHAELTPDAGAWYIRDLGSQNGTWVNGQRIAERLRLKAGDQIRTGATLMVYGRTERRADPDSVHFVRDNAGANVRRALPSNEDSVLLGDSVLLSETDHRHSAVDHLRVIYQLTTLTTQLPDRQQLLEGVMDLAFAEFHPEHGVIMLRDSEDDDAALPTPVVVRFARPEPHAAADGSSINLGAVLGDAPPTGSTTSPASGAGPTGQGADEAGRARRERIAVSRTIVQHCLSRNEGVLISSTHGEARWSSGTTPGTPASTLPRTASIGPRQGTGAEAADLGANLGAELDPARGRARNADTDTGPGSTGAGGGSGGGVGGGGVGLGDSIARFNIRSAICAPIRFRDRTFGVIYIDSAPASPIFTPEQLALLNAVGQHTGLALANAELYAAKLQNERLAAMGETVATLSHSIKNILQGLRGGADVVEMGLKKEDLKVSSGGWAILKRNLDRIIGLTMNMLAYSRPRATELELARLAPLLDDCASLLKDVCAARGVVLLVDCDIDMPPVAMDPGQMHQAVLNLMTNAVEAVESRVGVVTVRASYIEPEHKGRAMGKGAGGSASGAGASGASGAGGGGGGGTFRIDVIDNGPGVPGHMHKRIFEPFVTTKGLRGTGLGLAVTRRIVEQHAGHVEVRSPVGNGRGACFSVVLSAGVGALIDPSQTTDAQGKDRPGL